MIEYLRGKIGYVEDGKNYGMCSSVLNKCQDLTYTGKNTGKTFDFDNDVIKQYLQRTMIQIKAQQDTVLASYADSCISDVASCLSQNNYNYSGLNNSTNTGTTYSDAAINACMSIIKTCKSATTHSMHDTDVYTWLDMALGTVYACQRAGGTMQANGKCKIVLNGADYYADMGTGVMQTLADTTYSNVSAQDCGSKLETIATVANDLCVLKYNINSNSKSKTPIVLDFSGTSRTFTPSPSSLNGVLIGPSTVTKKDCEAAASQYPGLAWETSIGRCVYK